MRPAPAKLRRLFPPEPLPPERVHTSMDKGHGRLEKRTVRTTTILTLRQKWPGLAQGLEITRERTVQGKTTVEVEYAMTSLKPEQADAKRLSELREHWGIENGLHYVRDMTLAEDACRVRKGAAPQVLAALRNAVVHLLSVEAARQEGLSRAGACDHFAANPAKALSLLGVPHL